MSEVREALEERAQKAILQHAFMRWESIGLLMGTGLATYFDYLLNVNLPAPAWAWLTAGVIGYGILAYSSLTDDEGNRKVVERLLQSDYNPKKINNPKLKKQIEQALEYRSKITDLINQRSDESALKVQLIDMASQFDDWIEEIYILAGRLDEYEAEKPRLESAYRNASERITQLTRRLQRVRDQKVKDDITNNINGLNRQIDTIESLSNTMNRAELRLENTLTAMGTIYPQTILLTAKDIDSSRYKRLQQDIADEVDELADVLYAMDEVYEDSSI